MPWENTDEFIRSGHRDPDEFQNETLKTISINENEGIKAVIGKPKGKDSMEVLSYLFENVADMLKSAELGFIRQEEFRKNAVKLGWELWEKPSVEISAEGTR